MTQLDDFFSQGSVTLCTEASIDIDNLLAGRPSDSVAMKLVGEALHKFLLDSLYPETNQFSFSNLQLLIIVIDELIPAGPDDLLRPRIWLSQTGIAFIIARRLIDGRPTELEMKFCLLFSKRLRTYLQSLRDIRSSK